MDVEVGNDLYIPKINDSVFVSLFGDTKISFIALLVAVVFIYVVIFFVLGNNSILGGSLAGSGTNIIVFLLEIVLWVILIYVVYINLKKNDTQNYDFQAKMEDLFNTKISEMTVNASSNKTSGQDSDASNNDKTANCPSNTDSDYGKEVFHIADNVFTYEEARDVCERYDARLANYEEIENAYMNGANWCSYGWSKDRLALFPTQKSLYNELKQIPGHENDCGRPGINGGYFKDKLLKFGANCYGVKPKPRKRDKDYTHAINHTPEIENADKAKNMKNSKYIVAPFNKDKWTIKDETN